ncbi:MAG: PDZ domain-containing protein [Planctomycetota bacterium]
MASLTAVHNLSPYALAQAVKVDTDDGTMVQIGPDRGVSVDVDVDGDRARALRERRRERRADRQPRFGVATQAVSRYWIGVGGGLLPPELRDQLDIADNEGVLIRTVAPEGPAAQAGVKPYDIVLRANDRPISDLGQLADLVGEQGEQKGSIEIDVLRKGRPVAITVTPIERPLEQVNAADRRRGRGLFGPDGVFGADGLDGLFAGPGMQFGEGAFGEFGEMIPQMAMGGVSVSVQRQNDGPAQVTVRRGDQTWEFNEGDADAIGALPDDVRPMVERMLQRNAGAADGFEAFGLNAPGFQLQLDGEGLAGRIRAMQERMRALQGEFGGGAVDPGLIEPEIELDEAPAFNSEDAGPVEVEIPETLEQPIEIEVE